MARTRQVHPLRRAAEPLLRVHPQAALRAAALDLLTEELRLAHRALAEIAGQLSTKNLLGVFSSRFCIVSLCQGRRALARLEASDLALRVALRLDQRGGGGETPLPSLQALQGPARRSEERARP